MNPITAPSPMASPYIGVTGIVHESDVEAARRIASTVTRPGSHRFMAGVLVSAKTLAGEVVTNRRYPAVERLDVITKTLADFAFTTAHFNTRLRTALDAQLEEIIQVAPSIHGIQLNIRRPDPDALALFRSRHPEIELILQANGSSLRERTPDGVREFVEPYIGIANHVLLDLSGGNGVALDPDWAAAALNWNRDLWSQIRPGVAGGIGPDSAEMLQRLRSDTSGIDFSIDAEGRIRRPVLDPINEEPYQDTLDEVAASAYVRTAFEVFTPNPAIQPVRGRTMR